ncbi:hypothetical protein MP638_001507 [Amoeboaphelidium occidentale]|nr:hypothetical protein MP638_001507 [Amoeboaphelidium occidentale]
MQTHNANRATLEELSTKLTHPIKEIRTRALDSLKFKLQNSILKIQQIVSVNIILKSLLQVINLINTEMAENRNTASGSKDHLVFVLQVLSDVCNSQEGCLSLIDIGAYDFFVNMRMDVLEDSTLLALVDEILLKLRCFRKGPSLERSRSGRTESQQFSTGLDVQNVSIKPKVPSKPSFSRSLKLVPRITYTSPNDGWMFDVIHLSPIDTKFVHDFLVISQDYNETTKFVLALDILLSDYGAQVFLHQPRLFDLLLARSTFFPGGPVDGFDGMKVLFQFVSAIDHQLLKNADTFKCINQSAPFVNNTPEVSYSGTQLNDILNLTNNANYLSRSHYSTGRTLKTDTVRPLHRSNSQNVDSNEGFDRTPEDFGPYSIPFVASEIFVNVASFLKRNIGKGVEMESVFYALAVLTRLINYVHVYNDYVLVSESFDYYIDHVDALLEAIRNLDTQSSSLILLFEAFRSVLIAKGDSKGFNFSRLQQELVRSSNHKEFNDKMFEIRAYNIIHTKRPRKNPDSMLNIVKFLVGKFLPVKPISPEDEMLLSNVIGFFNEVYFTAYEDLLDTKIYKNLLSILSNDSHHPELHKVVMCFLRNVVPSEKSLFTQLLDATTKKCLDLFSKNSTTLHDRNLRMECVKLALKLSLNGPSDAKTTTEWHHLFAVLTQTVGCLIQNYSELNNFTLQNRAIFRLIVNTIANLSSFVAFGDWYLFSGSIVWILSLLNDDELIIQKFGLIIVCNLLQKGEEAFNLVDTMIPSLVEMLVSFGTDMEKEEEIRSIAFRILTCMILVNKDSKDRKDQIMETVVASSFIEKAFIDRTLLLGQVDMFLEFVLLLVSTLSAELVVSMVDNLFVDDSYIEALVDELCDASHPLLVGLYRHQFSFARIHRARRLLCSVVSGYCKTHNDGRQLIESIVSNNPQFCDMLLYCVFYDKDDEINECNGFNQVIMLTMCNAPESMKDADQYADFVKLVFASEGLPVLKCQLLQNDLEGLISIVGIDVSKTANSLIKALSKNKSVSFNSILLFNVVSLLGRRGLEFDIDFELFIKRLKEVGESCQDPAMRKLISKAQFLLISKDPDNDYLVKSVFETFMGSDNQQQGIEDLIITCGCNEALLNLLNTKLKRRICDDFILVNALLEACMNSENERELNSLNAFLTKHRIVASLVLKLSSGFKTMSTTPLYQLLLTMLNVSTFSMKCRCNASALKFDFSFKISKDYKLSQLLLDVWMRILSSSSLQNLKCLSLLLRFMSQSCLISKENKLILCDGELFQIIAETISRLTGIGEMENEIGVQLNQAKDDLVNLVWVLLYDCQRNIALARKHSLLMEKLKMILNDHPNAYVQTSLFG